MSRLETNAEPSMEEILASIRKIIAEEPQGSRSIPPMPRSGGSAPAPAPQRGFMSREAFMRSTHDAEPDTRASSPAPAAPSRSDRSAETKPARAASPGRQEPVAGVRKPEAREAAPSSRHVTDRPLEAAEKPAKNDTSPAGLEADAASIDAQLVKLLGDDLKALRDAESGSADGASEVNGEKGGSLKNGARGEAREGGDPFAFDLGPSPFSSRSEKPATDRQDAAETRAPSRPGGERNTAATPEREHFANGRAAPTAPANPAAPAYGAAANGIDSDRFSASGPRELFGVPSVSATLGPHRNLEPLSASFRPSSDRFGGTSGVETQPSQAPGGYPSSESRRGFGHEMRDAPRRDSYSSILQPAPESDAALDRAIEDTVADLLRPMLRTWLAENMPRIVERALRREMSERLLPGQKNPLD